MIIQNKSLIPFWHSSSSAFSSTDAYPSHLARTLTTQPSLDLRNELLAAGAIFLGLQLAQALEAVGRPPAAPLGGRAPQSHTAGPWPHKGPVRLRVQDTSVGTNVMI